jgi:hypothetical protein
LVVAGFRQEMNWATQWATGVRASNREVISTALHESVIVLLGDRLLRRRLRSQPRLPTSVTRSRCSSAARMPSASSRRCAATIPRSRRSCGSRERQLEAGGLN